MNHRGQSVRQLAVAAVVSGLSPAAVYAGSAPWFWVLLWSGCAVLLSWLILWWVSRSTMETMPRVIKVLYAGWAVVVASLVLERAVDRLEQTSGGSPRFWLLVIITVPLLLIGWGGAAPFFRTVEILWLAMAAVLVLVLLLAFDEIELRYLTVNAADWKTAALAVGEMFVPALFTLPYIYNEKGGERTRCLGWLSAMGVIGGGMCLLTVGVLGAGGDWVPQAFFVAAGVGGRTARMEGLFAVLWLIPDLVFVGLLSRTWGERRWPAAAILLAAVLSFFEVTGYFTPPICVIGSLLLLGMTLLWFVRRSDFVVKKSQ